MSLRQRLCAVGTVVLLSLLPGCGNDGDPARPESREEPGGDFVHLVAGPDIDLAYDITVAPNGDRLVTGGFTDRVGFRSAGAVARPDSDSLSANGGSDAFIVAYRPDGTRAWGRAFGGPGGDSGLGVAVDDAGGIYLAMGFEQTVQMGATSLTSHGALDVMVGKLGPDHTPEWAFGAGGGSIDQPWRVAVHPAGGVVVTGSFRYGAYFGTAVLNALGYDAFLLRLDDAGDVMWVRGLGGRGDDDAFGVGTDAGGNIYVSGTYTDSTNFGGTILHTTGPPGDAFVASYAANATLRWVRSVNGAEQARGFGLAISGGRLFVAGDFKETVSAATGQVTSAGNYDGFVACYTLDGDFLWIRRFGGSGEDVPLGLAADGASGVLVTGSFEESADFGTRRLTAVREADVFLLRVDAGGSITFAEGYGGRYEDAGIGVAAAGDHGVIVGVGAGTMSFNHLTVTSAGLTDGFFFQR